ncbi:MAG: hypothetical protein Q9163_000948 [Psora crenata]
MNSPVEMDSVNGMLTDDDLAEARAHRATEESRFIDLEVRYMVLQQENLDLKQQLEIQQAYVTGDLHTAGLRISADDVGFNANTNGLTSAQPAAPPNQRRRGPVNEPTFNRDDESPTTASKPQYLYDNEADKLRQTLLNTLITRCVVAKVLGDWTLMEKHAVEAVRLSQELDYQPLQARCHYYRGVALYHRHLWHEAYEALQDSLPAKGKYIEPSTIDAWIEKAGEAIEGQTPDTAVEEVPIDIFASSLNSRHPFRAGWNVSSDTLIGFSTGWGGDFRGRHHRRASSSSLSNGSYRTAIDGGFSTPRPGQTFAEDQSNLLSVHSRSLSGNSSGTPPPSLTPPSSPGQRGMSLSPLRTPGGMSGDFPPIGKMMGLEARRRVQLDFVSPPRDTRALGDLLEGIEDAESENE